MIRLLFVLSISVNVSLLEPDLSRESVIVGGNASLSCVYPSSSSVKCLHIASENTYEQHVIFKKNYFNNSYLEKITTSVDRAAGVHKLTVNNAQLDDSGWFVCMDEGYSLNKCAMYLDVNGW
jgi:hypothetical protein